jgi:hypothetical protein
MLPNRKSERLPGSRLVAGKLSDIVELATEPGSPKDEMRL